MEMLRKAVVQALRERLCTQRSIDLTADEVYHLLSSDTRRHVIRHLAHDHSAGARVDTKDLAWYVAAVKQGDARHVSDEQQKYAHSMLLHHTLPTLAAEGVVDWEQGSKTAGRGEGVEALAQLIGEVDRATAAADAAARYLLTDALPGSQLGSAVGSVSRPDAVVGGSVVEVKASG